MLRFISSALLMVSLAFVTPVLAQDFRVDSPKASGNKFLEYLLEPTQAKAVPMGTYRDLTLLRKLKLGTAPFVNPTLLKTTVVAYRYDADAVAAAIKSAQLGGIEIKATMAVAKEVDGKFQTMFPDDPAWSKFVEERGGGEKLEFILAVLAKAGFVVLSTSDHILDQPHVGKVVAWDAVRPENEVEAVTKASHP